MYDLQKLSPATWHQYNANINFSYSTFREPHLISFFFFIPGNVLEHHQASLPQIFSPLTCLNHLSHNKETEGPAAYCLSHPTSMVLFQCDQHLPTPKGCAADLWSLQCTCEDSEYPENMSLVPEIGKLKRNLKCDRQHIHLKWVNLAWTKTYSPAQIKEDSAVSNHAPNLQRLR